jgi:hypothetical protein
VAFLIAKEPTARADVAVADVSTGRILRRFTFEKGVVKMLTSTPDGKSLYLAAEGSIWSMMASGGPVRKVRAGISVAVYPDGKHLLVKEGDNTLTRWIRVSLSGGAEQEIVLRGAGELLDIPIQTEMIGRDSRLVIPLKSPTSFFVAAGLVDLATGRVTRIAVGGRLDYEWMAWERNGSIIAVGLEQKSALWKFEPEGR